MKKQSNKKVVHIRDKRLKDDFRYFMIMLWKEIGLPQPTKLQKLFGYMLQHSKERQLCLLGFRGFAKTLICAAFETWYIYKEFEENNGIVDKKVTVWGSTLESAADTTTMALGWVQNIPWLQHLAPSGDELKSAGSGWDVQGKGTGVRGTTVSAFGINGAITGTRADLLIVDDPETSNNGGTPARRLSLQRNMDEAVNVVTAGGRIIVLGTIHFDDSIYLRLLNKGYRIWLFPMSVPGQKTKEQCWEFYPQPVKDLVTQLAEDAPLDRFGAEEIALKKTQGQPAYERQCLVNPFRSESSKKPFQMSKLIVFDADVDKVPRKYFHGSNPEDMCLESMNKSSAALTDKLFRPYKRDEIMVPYDRKILVVDPAGSGTDEMAIAVIGAASGYCYINHVSGMIGGGDEENLLKILQVANRHKVDGIYIETNFGMDFLVASLRSLQVRSKGALLGEGVIARDLIPIVGFKNTTNKARRIEDAIGPLLNVGQMVITPDALANDFDSANIHLREDRMIYRLTYQMSYFTTLTEGKLDKDDRLDVVAMGIMQLGGLLQANPENIVEEWDYMIVKKAFEQAEEVWTPSKPKQKIKERMRGTFLGRKFG